MVEVSKEVLESEDDSGGPGCECDGETPTSADNYFSDLDVDEFAALSDGSDESSSDSELDTDLPNTDEEEDTESEESDSASDDESDEEDEVDSKLQGIMHT